MTQPEDVDIVDRLRVFKYPLELEAADEIERLRKERDEARQKYCDLFAFTTGRTAADVAKSLGWDCFKPIPPDEIDASDMLVIYEAARLALSDDDTRSDLGEFLDLSDQHLHSILLKIERHLNQ